jgi:hypothetical protein
VRQTTSQRFDWAGLPRIATVARLLCRELTLQNEYLRQENKILKSKVKGRIRFDDDERRSLVDAALAMGRSDPGGGTKQALIGENCSEAIRGAATLSQTVSAMMWPLTAVSISRGSSASKIGPVVFRVNHSCAPLQRFDTGARSADRQGSRRRAFDMLQRMMASP